MPKKPRQKGIRGRTLSVVSPLLAVGSVNPQGFGGSMRHDTAKKHARRTTVGTPSRTFSCLLAHLARQNCEAPQSLQFFGLSSKANAAVVGATARERRAEKMKKAGSEAYGVCTPYGLPSQRQGCRLDGLHKKKLNT